MCILNYIFSKFSLSLLQNHDNRGFIDDNLKGWREYRGISVVSCAWNRSSVLGPRLAHDLRDV